MERVPSARMRGSRLLALLFAATFVEQAFSGIASAQQAPPERWAATWSSASSLPVPSALAPRGMAPPTLSGTVRYRMRISAGGERFRIALSGGAGIDTLSIDAATIGIARGERLDTRSVRRLRFGGAAGVLIQSGAQIVSDAVDLSAADGAVVVVSLHLAQAVEAPQADPPHVVLVRPGRDRTSAADVGGAAIEGARPLVTAIHVEASHVDRVIVAFGDSITDGNGATDPLMRGWPDFFAARLRRHGLDDVAIVNQGIGGNRLLQDRVGESALNRFDRDALTVPGVTDIIVMEGINDLGLSGLSLPSTEAPFRTLTARDVIWAYQQLIDRAHARGVRIIGATLTPALGTPFPGYATVEKEIVRQEINRWIRTSGAFDAVIDFDAAVRDPNQPERLLDAYDAGDRLHPSDAGYRAMAEAIDLDLFR